MERKYIVVTGGTLSGLGKGVAIASVGSILSHEYKVVPIKCDGYLNVDPGTMNPIEHGEVFVLDDGGEVDMDFGHYERFLGISCKLSWNLTMGKVFSEIREKERRGDYLGKTVQMIPHVTDHIVHHFLHVGEESGADIVLIEIGGTVGDMENDLYLEAARRMANTVGRENMAFIHLSYVPIPNGVNEQKSKPTQQSIALLRQKGISPDIIINRCSEMLTDHVRSKIADFANLSKDAVITGLDVDNIYKIPLLFRDQGVDTLLSHILNIPVAANLEALEKAIERKQHSEKRVTIAIAGKYTDLEDSYASIVEALTHCSFYHDVGIDIEWIDTDNGSLDLGGVCGVIVPGGFGSRGIEGKIEVIRTCREQGIPFLGICYGMQMAVVEFLRNVCGLSGAHTTEINKDASHPVVDILESQKDIKNLGGTMRLGAYPAKIKEGSFVHAIYGDLEVSERHRHRYEVNPEYHKMLHEKGMIISGMSPDGTLAEFIELPQSVHPYFVGTQAHPELKSSLISPAPLFREFVRACVKSN